jgi:hypothetical protein
MPVGILETERSEEPEGRVASRRSVNPLRQPFETKAVSTR